MQSPGSSQDGSGRVSTRCVCVPACPFRRDFASAGRSPKAVPEKRGAAAAARGTMAVRETAVPTSPACRSRNKGNRSSERNSSASQGRHPSSCPTSPACKQPNMQPIPSAQHAALPSALPSANPFSACSSCRSGAGARSSKSCRGQRHTTLRHCAQRHQLRLLHQDGSPSLRLCF